MSTDRLFAFVPLFHSMLIISGFHWIHRSGFFWSNKVMEVTVSLAWVVTFRTICVKLWWTKWKPSQAQATKTRRDGNSSHLTRSSFSSQWQRPLSTSENRGNFRHEVLKNLMENGEETGLASCNCCLKLDSEYGFFQPQLNVSSLSGILVEHSLWSRICCHHVCHLKI
jgi:hypothetical protein